MTRSGSHSRHYISDISFSAGWCRCACGELLVSSSEAAMEEDWNAHRKAGNGTRPPRVGDQTGKSPVFSLEGRKGRDRRMAT